MKMRVGCGLTASAALEHKEYAMRAMHSVTFAAVIATGIALTAAPFFAQAQQKYPAKPVRLVVGLPAGSQTDTSARMMAQKMSESWGQPVVVENRSGAGGVLAANLVAKATPDGYTLLYATGFAISVALQTTLPYDPIKDFAGVAQISTGTLILAVAPALEVKSVKDLIALAKAQPGKIIYSSGGAGTISHLYGESVRLAAGIKVVNVKFNAGVEALIETMAGRTHYGFPALGVALPFIKDGKVRALAVTTPQRSPLLPEVPTLTEMLPDFRRPDNSSGLLAPAKTPRPIVNQISKEAARILNQPDIKERLQGMGGTPAPTTPEEYDKILRSQIETITRLAIDIGLRAK
jgi:tripartite-type tricarboxylate transporter receptor subunit TctC